MRTVFGRFLQVLGLLLMPVAVVHGVSGGEIFDELLLFGAAMGLWMIGAGLREPKAPGG